MRKLRILCLHGYHGSAKTLRMQMQPVTEGLQPLAEFVCVDAPSLAIGDFGWWHAVSNDGADPRHAGVVPSSHSDHLASFFKDPLILRHSGGHVVPSDPQVRNGVAAFLQERARDADLAYGSASRNV